MERDRERPLETWKQTALEKKMWPEKVMCFTAIWATSLTTACLEEHRTNNLEIPRQQTLPEPPVTYI